MVLSGLLLIAGAMPVVAQQPISTGPDGSGGWPGISRYFDWFRATPSGCTAGAGACVGAAVQGDTYYMTGWLPNASGLPVTSGLPIVGTANDYGMLGCSGNLMLLQLDTWSWAAPTASHVTKINCMTDYGVAPGTQNSPAGWFGHLTSADSGQIGTWKNRQPFSRGGILYMGVERQITTGVGSVHDGTIIMSPDSGKHWCNPYTLYNVGTTPGVCNSSKWSATGDAPLCGAASGTVPCTDAGYGDATHSSMMFKSLPFGTDNWLWINYMNQDGQAPPTGVNDGCDPATYVCFMLLDGSVARTTNVMDISAWQYYTCPTITMSYRCSGLAASSWTSTFSSRTLTFVTGIYGSQYSYPDIRPIVYASQYIKEFGSYCMSGLTWSGSDTTGLELLCGPAPYGPFVKSYSSTSGGSIHGSFILASPALGYTVVSTSPPHVKLTFNSNNYSGGEGSLEIYELDLVLGRQITGGESYRAQFLPRYQHGAGYQFSLGSTPGAFPLAGMVWSFDFLDYGYNTTFTTVPYFLESGNRSATLVPCDGTVASPTNCGILISSRGDSMNIYGAEIVANGGYGAHFRSRMADFSSSDTTPPMQGNASYSVVTVMRYESPATHFSRQGGIWASGVASTADNTQVELNQSNGALSLDWNATFMPHYRYLSSFTFPNFTNWYFLATTVQAATASNCAKASIWVGQSGAVSDTLAGVSCTAMPGTTPAVATKTPNVSAGPFVIGLNGNGENTSMTTATTMVYNRALTSSEIQTMYRSMKTKMAQRGVTLQ